MIHLDDREILDRLYALGYGELLDVLADDEIYKRSSGEPNVYEVARRLGKSQYWVNKRLTEIVEIVQLITT